jgi:hypothetical protein
MRPFRARWLAWAVAAALAGCGPGEGGTGDGETNAFQAFSATPAPICAAPFAAALSCARTTTSPGEPITPDVLQGTQVINFVDTAQKTNVLVEVQANSIALQARCEQLDFTGDWGIAATTDARFFGTYVSPTTNRRVPASLSVSGDEAGSVVVVIRGVDGRVVFGPVTLERVQSPPSGTPRC